MNVGAAEVDITPNFEVELCGFALREQPCAGVLDPIFARCVYLDDGQEHRLLWLVADVLALEGTFVEDFRGWARRQFGLQAHEVLLVATHTHAAPATITLNAAGRKSDRFVVLLRERMEQIVRAAVADAQPCDIVFARGHLDLAIDRRNKPTKHVDPMVWSIGFRQTKGGRFVAAVLNYAMHPVSLGHNERRISPDWCGGAATALRDALATQGADPPVILVTNGACGNVNPPYHGASRELVFAWGKAVADAVADQLRRAGPTPGALLSVRSIKVPIPMDWHDPDEVDRIAEHMIRDLAPQTTWPAPFTQAAGAWRDTLKPLVASGGGRTHEIEIQCARVGEVTVIAINGEIFARFTDDLRRATGEQKLFVVGYANAAFGYIPTRDAYAEGGYEVEAAHFFYNSFRPAPGALELLCDRAADLVCSP
ncbi:MAG TPA: neutral/alkaline non-lysosomal ceramidase N-terminal domain-containing protein [Tepidisphaeraceae bacterium]|nr:neutral/alkaline non-lysosomal ceramidase N-terminal domain-containing protein [Tepidisphaeraceae bacterium]